MTTLSRRDCRHLLGMSRAQVYRVAARARAEQQALVAYRGCAECLTLGLDLVRAGLVGPARCAACGGDWQLPEALAALRRSREA